MSVVEKGTVVMHGSTLHDMNRRLKQRRRKRVIPMRCDGGAMCTPESAGVSRTTGYRTSEGIRRIQPPSLHFFSPPQHQAQEMMPLCKPNAGVSARRITRQAKRDCFRTVGCFPWQGASRYPKDCLRNVCQLQTPTPPKTGTKQPCDGISLAEEMILRRWR